MRPHFSCKGAARRRKAPYPRGNTRFRYTNRSNFPRARRCPRSCPRRCPCRKRCPRCSTSPRTGKRLPRRRSCSFRKCCPNYSCFSPRNWRSRQPRRRRTGIRARTRSLRRNRRFRRSPRRPVCSPLDARFSTEPVLTQRFTLPPPLPPTTPAIYEPFSEMVPLFLQSDVSPEHLPATPAALLTKSSPSAPL